MTNVILQSLEGEDKIEKKKKEFHKETVPPNLNANFYKPSAAELRQRYQKRFK